MSDWKPPPFGTPVWMAIPAKDLDRASEFYKKVFNLPLKKPDPERKSADEVRMFDLSQNGVNLHGGLVKAPDETGAFNVGRGGICISWMVEDVDASAKIIEEAGGKMLTGKVKEGEGGIMRYFEDSEGTVGNVYMLVK